MRAVRSRGASALWGVASVAVAACGGGGPGTGTTPATNESGQVVRSAGGEAVSVEAHNRWTAAVADFARFEREGWNAERCTRVSEAFEAAADAQRGFAEALYMTGLAAARCGDEGRSLSFYNRALEANERLCKARVAVGALHAAAGRESQAYQAFERAVRDDAQCTEGYVQLAILQRQRGGNMVEEALSNLRRALAIESDYLPAFNEMALLYLAQAATNTQALDLASVVCRQAQQINADYAPIYNTWGLINMRKGNIIEALQMFDRARRLDDHMFEAQMNFGQITLSFRGYEDARAAFTRAVELQPRSYEAIIGLGVALRGLNQPQEAKARYEAAAQVDAARPDAFFNLGVLYQDYMSGSVEDLNRAKSYFEQFLVKAGDGASFREKVEEVRRRCREQQPAGPRRRRARQTCRPGRLQNIATAVEALQAAAEIQRQAAEQQTPPSAPAPAPAPAPSP